MLGFQFRVGGAGLEVRGFQGCWAWDFEVTTFKATLPETNMETQKGPYKDYSPFKKGLYGFPC